MSAIRIVSLVPSLTHMLCDLGLKSSIVGCTTFCVDPPDLRRLAVDIGGTKDPDLEKILALRPTHILVNEEENKLEHIVACEVLAPTLRTFPKNPHDVPELLRRVGEWVGKKSVAEEYGQKVERHLSRLADLTHRTPMKKSRYIYLIWKDPYMAVSDDTYIGSMLGLIGLENVGLSSIRYPTLSIAEMIERSPNLIFLSSEPYPFRLRDISRLREEWLSQSQLSTQGGKDLPTFLKVDGKLLSWYGSMTAQGLDYLEQLQRDIMNTDS